MDHIGCNRRPGAGAAAPSLPWKSNLAGAQRLEKVFPLQLWPMASLILSWAAARRSLAWTQVQPYVLMRLPMSPTTGHGFGECQPTGLSGGPSGSGNSKSVFQDQSEGTEVSCFICPTQHIYRTWLCQMKGQDYQYRGESVPHGSGIWVTFTAAVLKVWSVDQQQKHLPRA